MTTACCLLAVVPVVPSLWMALVVAGGVGLVTGIAVHAMMVLSGEMSKRHAASIHINSLAIYIGEFTGPLIISFFLSDNDYHLEHSTISAPMPRNHNDTFVSQNSKDEVCNHFRSNVVYGFFFIASLGIIVFAGYLISVQLLHERIRINDSHVKKYQTIKAHPYNKFDVIVIIIMTIYTTVCAPMIFVYGQFLPTFGIYCSLYSSTRLVTNISLSFYACAIVGQLLGVFSSQVVTQTVLINICTAGGMLLSSMLIYVSEINTACLWIGTSVLAIVCAPVFSAVETWALGENEHRHILYGISSTADMVGYSAMSLLTGQLMACAFVQMLNYIMTAVSLLQLLLIVLLYLTVKRGKQATPGSGS
ncbi:uncharacterized protein LOC124264017 [Haliotis rubra]|uniref:uncharacterized protein LOC124264017 n=1 Tax=Haliotis rubra TaxID=36100 RepID=UPI001EE5A858|nr:uncharacterized protein LOC124264017 [Haliotis rubra]